MSSKAITFPVTDNGDRRNAETGVEIVRRRRGVYAVTAPQSNGGAYKIGDDLSYAEARKAAIETVEAIRDELRGVIERAQRPAERPDLFDALDSTPDLDMPDLLLADDKLLDRIVKRAAYDALKAVAGVLDGWQEVSRENHQGMGHRDRFEDCCGRIHPQHVLTMLDDAAGLVGTRKLNRKVKTDAS